ncbi:MAG: hypothetical protein ABIL25_10275 [candidate division WOR-3 bacterium]
MVWLTVTAFLLTIVAAFVGFREFLPGVLTVLAKVLFVLSLAIGLVGLNILILRRPMSERDPSATGRPPDSGS